MKFKVEDDQGNIREIEGICACVTPVPDNDDDYEVFLSPKGTDVFEPGLLESQPDYCKKCQKFAWHHESGDLRMILD